MTRVNYCEFFRFNDGFCDVFVEEPGHFLYVETTAYDHAYLLTCKEFAQTAAGEYICSCYAGADIEYLQTLTPAHETIAREIIASEERYTLECMASDYGYTRQYVVDCYHEMIDDGNNPHEVFEYIAACMMEHDL